MRVTCPTCQEAVAPDDVNVQRAFARCRRCSEVFGFADQLPGTRASTFGGSRPAVALPRRFSISGPPLRLSFRWLRAEAFFLLFFALFWNGIVSVFVVNILRSGDVRALLFLSLHLAVGAFVAYRALCLFVNRTDLRLDAGRLRVRHGPLPWPGNRELSAGALRQLWARERVTRGKNGTSVSYEVNATLQDGKTVKLVSGLPQAEQALWLEQQLETHLGIQDQPVAGELPR